MDASKIRFIRSQGFRDRTPTEAFHQALMFQPRMVGVLLALCVALQSPLCFAALSAALGWNALVPSRNIFDAVYNRTIASRRGRARLEVAPAPRRFAQGLASALALVIAISLPAEATMTAAGAEVVLGAAVIALVFGRFCVGSFVFHLFFPAEPRVVQLVPRPAQVHDQRRGAR